MARDDNGGKAQAPPASPFEASDGVGSLPKEDRAIRELDRGDRLRFQWTVAVVALAVLPRIMGTFDPLWLDEVWSLALARQVGDPLDVFVSIHHDNNHYLNTLWMWWLGAGAPAFLHRLPSLLAGVATVMVAVRLAGGASSRGGLLAALLFGSAYPLVHYGSEARGYALAVLAALAAYAVLEDLHRRGRLGPAWVFGAVSTVGLGAHLTYVLAQFPLMAWSVWRAREWRRTGRSIMPLVVAHGIPLVALSTLVLVDLRFLERGGGPSIPPLEGLIDGWRYVFGLPEAGLATVLGSAILLAAVTSGFLRAAGDAWGAGLFLWLVVAGPALLAYVGAPGYAPLRYFLIPLTFVLLLAARGLAEWWQLGTAARGVVVLTVGMTLTGNGGRLLGFLEHGRGGYPEAVTRMAEASGAGTIRVGSDHDFRNGMILDHYRRALPDGLTIDYVPGDTESGVSPPAWYIVSAGSGTEPPAEVRRFRGASYRLDGVYPKSGLSGATWLLYRREPGTPRPRSRARRPQPPPNSTR